MSDPYMELVSQYENDNINTSYNPYDSSQDSLGLSVISKSKFSEPYHIYCNVCDRVQEINFISKTEVKLICKCTDSPKESPIKDCFKYLYKSDIIGIEHENLKCFFHREEKYGYYCQICEKNLCHKCADDDIDHKDKIIRLALDNDTIYKRRFIYDLIKEKNQYYIDNVEFVKDDCDVSKYKLVYKTFNNPKDEEVDQIDNISNDEVENNINKDEIKHEIINIMNDNNDEELDTNEFFLINLLQ